MRLPEKPMIGSSTLRDADQRPLEGPIQPGEVFAWEPDLPHARELRIVRRLYTMNPRNQQAETWVETWDMGYNHTTWNEEGRFRQACVRTVLNPFPTERPATVLPMLPGGLFQARRQDASYQPRGP